MKHFANYILMASIGVFLTLGCNSITSDSGTEIDQLTEIDQVTKTESSTANSNYKDADNNGIPDEGEVVTGTYKALYAYDDNGNVYFDLGDGRVQGNVDSVDELDQETLTTCDYKNQYRGDFGNDPSLDSGWVKNNINCKGYDDNGSYSYTMVHETDPRYTGNPDWEIWGTWEYSTYVVNGVGNVVRPENHVGS